MEQRPIGPDDVFWQLASLNQRIARIEQLLELLPILLVAQVDPTHVSIDSAAKIVGVSTRPFAAESELASCGSTCTSELVAPAFRSSRFSMDGWIYASPERRWPANADHWRRRKKSGRIDGASRDEINRDSCHRNGISVARFVACGKLGGKTLAN